MILYYFCIIFINAIVLYELREYFELLLLLNVICYYG
jgi:hypothetical protein